MLLIQNFNHLANQCNRANGEHIFAFLTQNRANRPAHIHIIQKILLPKQQQPQDKAILACDAKQIKHGESVLWGPSPACEFSSPWQGPIATWPDISAERAWAGVFH